MMRSRPTMEATGHCHPSGTSVAKVVGRSYSARRLRSKDGLAMNVRLSKPLDDGHSAKPAGAEYWHIWTVRIPRRSITGRLVWGRVWRRHDGYRWVYAHLDTPKSDLAR